MKRINKTRSQFTGENLAIDQWLKKEEQLGGVSEIPSNIVPEIPHKPPVEIEEPILITLPSVPEKSAISKIGDFVDKYKWVIVILSLVWWLYIYGRKINAISSKLRVK